MPTSNLDRHLYLPKHNPRRWRAVLLWIALAVGNAWCAALIAALPATAPSSSTSETKEIPMSTIETEEFKWGLSVSHYALDAGTPRVETLQYGNWFKDAQGNVVKQFYKSFTGYGWGGTPMGGNARMDRLPKTMRLSYYDYQENLFYELAAEIPMRKLYELFKQKTVDYSLDLGKPIPRYSALTIGIAPGGFVMLWADSGDGKDQVELAGPFQATTMVGMSVQRYNSETKPAFPINPNRWEKLSDHALKPETVERLKVGWVPDNTYYRKQRIRYPWRYRMSGNAKLLEFEEIQGNQEHFYFGPWQMANYNSMGAMRGIPSSATFWFNDDKGKRHSLFMRLSTTFRVNTERDLSAVWAAFETAFPKQELWQNDYAPSEDEMATVDVNLSEDLGHCTATLVKGSQRIDLPIGRLILLDLAPYAHWNGQETPTPEEIKRLVNGPDYKP